MMKLTKPQLTVQTPSHLFIKYLLSAYSLTSSVLGAKDRVLKKAVLLSSRSLHASARSHVTTKYTVYSTSHVRKSMKKTKAA